MKRLALFVIAFSMVTASYAKVRPTSLTELLSESDVIVHGKISQVGSQFITFKVLSVLKGLAGGMIKIQKFEDWTCATRFAPYQVGQEEVLFLLKKGNHYQIMGGGDEGECPIVNDRIYVSAAGSERKPTRQRVQLERFYRGCRSFQ